MALWDTAISFLNDEEQQLLDFDQPERREILSQLVHEVQKSKQLCIDRRLRYKKKNGETVVLYEVFEKIARWLHRFREIGDMVVQYDPGHAALPWAAVRFCIQAAMNDVELNGGFVEGLELVCQIVARYSAIESLYIRQQTPSMVTNQLRIAVTTTYVKILEFLCDCRRHFTMSSSRRIARAITRLPDTIVKESLEAISSSDETVWRYTRLVDAERLKEASDQQSVIATNVEHIVERVNDLQMHAETSESKLRSLTSSYQQPFIRTVQLILEQSRASSDHWRSVEAQQERRAILRWLSTIQYKNHHQSIVKNVLSGTGSWLLEDRRYIYWRNSSTSSVLWLHGIPGSGKSCLISTVIQHLLLESSNVPDAAPVIYFYCSRNPAEPERAEPKEILRALLKQIVIRRPNWLQHSPEAKEYRYRKDEADEDSSDIRKLDLSDVYNFLIKATKEFPLTIVVDALDECRRDIRHQLLSALTECMAESDHVIKIMLASREDADIVYKLKDFPSILVSAQENSADIKMLTISKVQEAIDSAQILNGNVSQSLQDDIVKALISKAQGMFLWVMLQLRVLCDNRRIKLEDDLRTELGSLPKSLGEMYSSLLEEMEMIEANGRTIAEVVLKWLLYAPDARTSTIITVCKEMASSKDHIDDLSIEVILDLCCNLVTHDHGTMTLRFAHLSVREFLELQTDFQPSAAHRLILVKLLPFWMNNFDLHEHAICVYMTRYWGYHYNYLSRSDRKSVLSYPMQAFLFGNTTTHGTYWHWYKAMKDELREIVTEWAYHYHAKSNNSFRASYFVSGDYNMSPLFLACIFQWTEIYEFYTEHKTPPLIAFRFKQLSNGRPSMHLMVADNMRSLEDRLPSLEILYSQCYYVMLPLPLQHSKYDLDDDAEPRLAWTHLCSAKHGKDLTIIRCQGSYLCSYGRTVQDNAIKRALLCLPAILSQQYILYTLLQANVTIGEFISELMQGTLAYAARAGDTTLIATLIDSGINPNSRDQHGQTALIAALQPNSSKPYLDTKENEIVDVVNMLLEKGTDISFKDMYGNTAMLYALRARLPIVVQILRDAGAHLPTGLETKHTDALWSSYCIGQEGVKQVLLSKARAIAKGNGLRSEKALDHLARLAFNGSMRVLAEADGCSTVQQNQITCDAWPQTPAMKVPPSEDN